MTIDPLTARGSVTTVLCERDRQREICRVASDAEVIIDGFERGRIEFRFVRYRPITERAEASIEVPLTSVRSLSRSWGLIGRDNSGRGGRTVWIPRPPRLISERDHAGRAIIEKVGDREWVSGPRGGVRCSLPRVEKGWMWTVPLVVIDDSDRSNYSTIESLSGDRWPHLAKSDWFSATSPADLWDALIDGDVFDPRQSVCGLGRFRCQQCAAAWRTYLTTVCRNRDGVLLKRLRREIAWIIRVQLEGPGGWRHGYLNREPETHVRFFVDGIGVLLDEAGSSCESAWFAAAESAVSLLVDQYTDDLADGSLWFLHDSLEGAGKAPPHKAPDLGQSPGNALVLNTHVQSLTALIRFSAIQRPPSARRTRALIDRGWTALRRQLELNSAPLLYGMLGRFVRPAVESKGTSGLQARLIRQFAFRAMPPLYWWIRCHYPRMVYPNGFIERDMAASILADDYLVLNLKDLLLLYAVEPRDWLLPVLTGGLDFLATLDLRRAIERSPFFLEVTDVHQMASQILGNDAGPVVDRLESQLETLGSTPSLDAAYWSFRPVERPF